MFSSPTLRYKPMLHHRPAFLSAAAKLDRIKAVGFLHHHALVKVTAPKLVDLAQPLVDRE